MNIKRKLTSVIVLTSGLLSVTALPADARQGQPMRDDEVG